MWGAGVWVTGGWRRGGGAVIKKCSLSSSLLVADSLLRSLLSSHTATSKIIIFVPLAEPLRQLNTQRLQCRSKIFPLLLFFFFGYTRGTNAVVKQFFFGWKQHWSTLFFFSPFGWLIFAFLFLSLECYPTNLISPTTLFYFWKNFVFGCVIILHGIILFFLVVVGLSSQKNLYNRIKRQKVDP